MHTGSKLNATARERTIELDQRFPFLQFATRPMFLVTAAATLFVFVIAFVAWMAGSAMHDMWSSYTDWLSANAEPQ